MLIPTPLEVLNVLNKMFFNFIWDGKPEKISRDKLCIPKVNGRLKMVNIFNFEKSMKLNWLKQMIAGNNKSWVKLLLNDVNISKFISKSLVSISSTQT